MSKSILCAKYSPVIYNGLGDIDVVDKQVNNQDIQKIGEVILKHGYEKYCFAIKSHRHFDLTPDEVMLERAEGGDCFVSKPVPLEEIEKCGAKPNGIALGRVQESDGLRWYPVFYAAPDEVIADADGNWRDPLEDEAFLEECADWLDKNGLDQKLMLGICREGYDPASGQLYLEENWGDTRTSELRPLAADGQFPESTIQTTFYFQRGENGFAKQNVVYGCMKICSSDKYGHGSDHI